MKLNKNFEQSQKRKKRITFKCFLYIKSIENSQEQSWT